MSVHGRLMVSVCLTILTLLTFSIAYSQSVRSIADTAFLSVVLITMEDTNGRRIATASGFFLREDLVATNFHAISEGVRGQVKRVGASTAYTIAGLVTVDQAKDLAIVKVAGVKAPSLRLGSDADARVGDRIYAVGNPLGLEGTFSDGIVSGIRRLGPRRLLQITAPISPGSSGGPVLDEKGLVIGIAVATLSGGQNLNFAIPVSDLAPLLANVGSVFPLPGQASITKRAPPARPGTSASSEAIAKAAADVLQAARKYRHSLERVLASYERELARREEVSELRSDLFRRGLLTKEQMREEELALAATRTNITDTRRAIEDIDRMIREAEEVLAIAQGGNIRGGR